MEKHDVSDPKATYLHLIGFIFCHRCLFFLDDAPLFGFLSKLYGCLASNFKFVCCMGLYYLFQCITFYPQNSMGSINPYYATIILGLIQVLGCTLGLFLVNKLGRRVLLLCSLAFCSLTMTGLAISVHMKWEWISLLSLILFTFSFMMGLSPVPWVLLGELPTGMRTVEEKM